VTWPGNIRVSRRIGGRRGGTVRLGDTVVPRRVVLTLDGENGEPDLVATFEVRDGRPECVGLEINSKDTGRGIRTADLQLFNIDALATTVFARFGEPVGAPAVDFPQTNEVALSAHRDVYEARKARRGSVTRAELERVAQVYREHVDSTPTKAVADLLGYEMRTAARRVERARADGLLPPTTPGKRKA
jgi:hypothetical protein